MPNRMKATEFAHDGLTLFMIDVSQLGASGLEVTQLPGQVNSREISAGARKKNRPDMTAAWMLRAPAETTRATQTRPTM